MTGLIILLIALALDIPGEPPNRFHPVAWLGKLISIQLRLTPAQGNIRQFAYGAWMVLFTTCIIALPISLFLAYIQGWNAVAYVLISAYLLKNTFSVAGLWKAVEKMKLSLTNNDLAGARYNARALVSRDTANLSRPQLLSAAVESCSENLCDSIVAPLLFYALFGLPGAIVYRIVNTFDAMIGYHGRWEHTGKFAARLDDVLNFVPARLSALLIVVASSLCKASGAYGWAGMLSGSGKTESPNAGWTMGAMAGSLGITLEKAGVYKIGTGSHELTLDSVSRSQAIMLTAALFCCLLVTGIVAVFNVTR